LAPAEAAGIATDINAAKPITAMRAGFEGMRSPS
jgi:hypothetical protein